jgi:hypothetical protein
MLIKTKVRDKDGYKVDMYFNPFVIAGVYFDRKNESDEQTCAVQTTVGSFVVCEKLESFTQKVNDSFSKIHVK